MDREKPVSRKSFKEKIESIKGLSEEQKKVFIRISEQTAFRQYAKKSAAMLDKICKTVKEQVKGWYDKKGQKIDRRGVLPLKKKGVTRKELKNIIEKDRPTETPIVITTGKKATRPKVPKEIRAKVTKAKTKERRKEYNQREAVKAYNRERKRLAYQKKTGGK